MRRQGLVSRRLNSIYQSLYGYFGPQGWWPADTAWEVVIGVILTQNTAWTNVEKAIAQLKKNRLLAPKKLYRAKTETIAKLIRPCGYYNVKARRLKNFLETLFTDFRGSLGLMFSQQAQGLREKLLEINGIGPESADSILLYAAKKPRFVVDAYSRRFLLRHRLIKAQDNYAQIQALFEQNLPHRVKLFNEYHALLVRLGKEFCRTKPVCNICPLKRWK